MGGAPAPADVEPRDLRSTVARGRPDLDAEQLVDELRTIATCVLGFTELLRGSDLSDDARQAYLSVLQEQATRLSRLGERLDEPARAR